MNDSMKRIGAILIKELQDIKTNVNILFMYLIPVLMTLAYQSLVPGLPEGFSITFGLMFLAVMAGMYVPSMIIAEEKEKKTMEVLMLSPATPAEVFIGKGFLTFLTILVTSVIMLLISGNGMRHVEIIFIGLVLLSISCIFIGMMVGLLAPNQMATGAIGLPLYLVFMMVPMFSFSGNQSILNVARCLPSYYYFDMLQNAYEKNRTLADLYGHLAFLTGSIIVTFGLLFVLYRKKGLE